MAEFDDALELSSFWNLEAPIVRELVNRHQVHVLPVDDNHAAGGRSAFFPDETFQIRNEVVEGEEVRRLAVDNIVFFAVGVLQKEPFVDGYEVGPVAQFNYEIKQREGQGIAVLLATFRERPLMRDKLVRVQFKTIRHRTIEEIADDVLNSVRCIAPALVADSDAAEHEYRLFYILEIGPGVPGLIQIEEMQGEAPEAAS
jgi:hypothetical protein